MNLPDKDKAEEIAGTWIAIIAVIGVLAVFLMGVATGYAWGTW